MLAFRRRSVLVLVLLVAGCADQPRNASDHGAATTATHAQSAKAGFPGPSQARSAVVTHISDGDTITLSGIGKTRLIGIDTPETYGQGECYGRAASRFTKRVLKPGTRVEYRLGTETHDRYGRALAYVWLEDGRMFNGLLAERGYATVLTVAPNVEYAHLFVAAARRARKAARGLWSPSTCSGKNGGDHDCADFRTQAEAQRYFDSRGGSETNNVDNLDGEDGDGRVCETLP
jgi:micrococcal nuclease